MWKHWLTENQVAVNPIKVKDIAQYGVYKVCAQVLVHTLVLEIVETAKCNYLKNKNSCSF